MVRRLHRLVPAGTRAPRILASARGKGLSDGDLRRAYHARLARIGPGNSGGSLYTARVGRRVAIIGIDADHADPSGEREVIFHAEWQK